MENQNQDNQNQNPEEGKAIVPVSQSLETQNTQNQSQGAKPGPDPRVLTDEEKQAAVLYVRATGFWAYRLADYLHMDYKTLKRILKDDPELSTRLKAAESEFKGELIRATIAKRPDFILETKYKDEFQKITKIDTTVNPTTAIKNVLDRIKEEDANANKETQPVSENQ